MSGQSGDNTQRSGTHRHESGLEPAWHGTGHGDHENPELAGHAQEIMNKSTIHGYQGAIRRYQDFCEAENYDRTIISEKSILHYLTHLHKNNVTIACVNQVRPALSLMIEMYEETRQCLRRKWIAGSAR